MKRFISFIFICVSAVLYVLSFMLTPAWWCIWLFTAPLYYSRLSFLNGFLWGVLAFGLHASGILWAVVQMLEGSLIVRITLAGGIVVCMAFHAGVWFWCVHQLQSVAKKAPFFCAFMLPVIHATFFWYMSYAFLWPLHGFEGYSLADPLLPALSAPGAGRIIALVGASAARYLLFLPISMVHVAIVSLRWVHLRLSLLALGVWMLPPQKSLPVPPWVQTIMPISIQWSRSSNSAVPVQMLRDTIARYPNKTIFITPESALYDPTSLSDAHVAQYLSIPDITLIAGSFSEHTGQTYNTLFYITDGLVRAHHHKHHRVFMTEGVPAWCTMILDTISPSSSSISCAPISHTIWHLNDQLSVEPYICSELFCYLQPRALQNPQMPILLCCNDRWFTGMSAYAARLMRTHAQLKAIWWHRPILYIGYQHAGYIDLCAQWHSFNIT